MCIWCPTGSDRIEFRPGREAPSNLASRIADELQKRTDMRWDGLDRLRGRRADTRRDRRVLTRDLQRRAAEHPIAKSVLAAFPGARITVVPHRGGTLDGGAPPAGDDTQDGWDPFEDSV